MNKVLLLGRMVADPELKYSQNNAAICRFRIATNRPHKQEGQPEADFFQITAWGKTAEFISKYFKKGQQILIEGYLRNNSWTDQQGNKRYNNEIHATQVYFADSKKGNTGQSQQTTQADIENSGFYDTEDEDTLPF